MKLHELQQARNTVAANMRSLHDEIGEAQWNEEQRAKWKSMKDDLAGIDERIGREEELRAADQKFVEDHAQEHRQQASKEQGDRREEAFDAFLRSGVSEMDAELRTVLRDMRAQGTSQSEKGGYTVPKEFDDRVREKMKTYGGLANIAQLLTTSDGREIDWATTDGTSEEGALIGENTAASEQDMSFGSESLGAKKLTSKIIRISNELLTDSAVSIEGLITDRLAMRIGRAEARLLIQGTGTGSPVQPKGLGKSVTGKVATASATKTNWKELNTLKHAVDPAYRNSNCRWLFNDNTLKIISEIEDSNGKPLWLPGLEGNVPATFLGHSYQVDQAVDDLAAGKQFIYFGDFKRFILRRVAGITLKRLVERYAEYDQVGFLGFARFDCVLEDAEAIKALIGKS